MKKLVFFTLVLLILCSAGAYKLWASYTMYLGLVEEMQTDTLVALQRLKTESGRVDYEKAKNLIEISSDRELSARFVETYMFTSLFMLLVVLLSATRNEFGKYKLLNKDRQWKD